MSFLLTNIINMYEMGMQLKHTWIIMKIRYDLIFVQAISFIHYFISFRKHQFEHGQMPLTQFTYGIYWCFFWNSKNMYFVQIFLLLGFLIEEDNELRVIQNDILLFSFPIQNIIYPVVFLHFDIFHDERLSGVKIFSICLRQNQVVLTCGLP